VTVPAVTVTDPTYSWAVLFIVIALAALLSVNTPVFTKFSEAVTSTPTKVPASMAQLLAAAVTFIFDGRKAHAANICVCGLTIKNTSIEKRMLKNRFCRHIVCYRERGAI
jgi:hypothetical protein